MYDPRWDDLREHDDGRARVYDERDRADHDPRDGLMRDLDLPRGEAREVVIDRDHMYELNGEDSRALAVVGAFRVVPERELGIDRDDAPDCDTIDHLRDEGLIRSRAPPTCGCRRHSNSDSVSNNCSFRRESLSTETALFEPP